MLFALLMIRVPYFRVANWPNTAVGLFLMGWVLVVAPLVGVLLDRTGALRVVGVVASLLVAVTVLTALISFFWVPRRLRHRFGEWDPSSAHPWLRKL